MTLGRTLGIIVILWASFYTISFGVWNWEKDNNKLGATVVILLALATLILPMYLMFFRAS